jgi:dTDP-4-amino-4,6-dideoxygalactose transaminase
VPLHSAPAGRKFGRFNGDDRWTTAESERLLRLPLYYQMEEEHVIRVAEAVKDYYGA